ncbi:MAG: methylated-DNA--[protein]-cysteine S-methyltransferase [Halioglobus sp.]|nr:methylated-DNA--[protein]-cysteine S-methyltransferase [Halioglobus sp.]
MTQFDLPSPIGLLRLTAEGGRLTAILFPDQHGAQKAQYSDKDPVLADCAQQLTEYFAGRRKVFDLPLGAAGTAFQQEVWDALVAIPYGEVRSYRDIAHAIRREKAVRAVGAANGRNPLPIVVPCHRVIGADGSLTGFAGGLDAKKKLLELEGALPA